MPRIQQIGPPSTPRLYFEDQYRLSQQQISQRYQNLQQRYQGQQIDYESALKEHADLQAEADGLTETFQSMMQMMRQSQKFVGLGIYSLEDHQKAMWKLGLPEEVFEQLYPEQAADPRREPFTPAEMDRYQEQIEDFTKLAVGKKRYGAFGWDWLAKDKPATQKTWLKLYNTWKVNIGYSAMTSGEQGQVDNEWDAWQASKDRDWNPESKEILAARGKGPLTRGYGARTKGTPLGPREAGDPIQSSIAAALPKKQEPKKEPEPRIWARNPKTKKRMFSDDGGRTWQAE